MRSICSSASARCARGGSIRAAAASPRASADAAIAIRPRSVEPARRVERGLAPSRRSVRSRSRRGRRPQARSEAPRPRGCSGRAAPPRPATGGGGRPRAGPCQCSTEAQRAVSSTRRMADSAGSSSVASSRAVRQPSNSPSDRCAEASATRISTWRSVSPPGSSRRAASNQRAATAGARAAAAPPGCEQDLDRVLVSLVRRLLDVVRLLGRVGAPSGEGLGRPGVGGEPPAAAGGLVDAPAHKRVAEAEAARARRSGRTKSRASRSSSAASPSASDSSAIEVARSGSNGSPATAAASRKTRDCADRTASSAASAAATAAGTPASTPSGSPFRRAWQADRAGGAPELLEVEGIAPGVAVDRRHQARVGAVEQLGGLELAQLPELEPGHGRSRRGRRQPLGRLAAAESPARAGPGRPAGGGRARRSTRSRRRHSSGGRRARARAAARRRSARAGAGPRGAPRSARRRSLAAAPSELAQGRQNRGPARARGRRPKHRGRSAPASRRRRRAHRRRR